MLDFLIKLIKKILEIFKNSGNVIEGDGQNSHENNDPFENETDDNYDFEPEHQTAPEEHHEETNQKEDMFDYSKVMVHLDGGHASTTAGKRSPWSSHKVKPELDFYEWKFNRIIVSKLSNKLESAGFKVHIVTPEEDKDISLTERYSRANVSKGKNPDLKHIFLSIHANAHGHGESWTSAEGWEVYTTKGQNNSDKLSDCLYDAAERILKPMGKRIRTEMSPDGDRDYEENFTVIWGANMPAVLTENFFYTNIKDTEFLLSEEGQDAIVDVHFEGIKAYAEKYLLK